jgi:hypothetical protein
MGNTSPDLEKGVIPDSNNAEKSELSQSEVTAFHVEDLEIGKPRAGSISSADDSGFDGESITGVSRAGMTQVRTGDSVPASVLTHPHSHSGVSLSKGPTGPKNNTIDEEGRIVVNWTSNDDPENPKNWTRWKKIFNVVVISSMSFLCPLCSSMFVSSLLLLSANFSRLVCRRSKLTSRRLRCWLVSRCPCS